MKSVNFRNKAMSIHKWPERINGIFNARKIQCYLEYLIYLYIVIGIQK